MVAINAEEHLGLAWREAIKAMQKWGITGQTNETDVLGEAYVGLCKAANKFDPSKGFKFSTYAVSCIRKTILCWLVVEDKFIRVPNTPTWNLIRIRRFTEKHGREPTKEETEVLVSRKIVNDSTYRGYLEQTRLYFSGVSPFSVIQEDHDDISVEELVDYCSATDRHHNGHRLYQRGSDARDNWSELEMEWAAECDRSEVVHL
jgi:RNA polymerase sigma factor (sigma-70 family)